jgi:hypothetical protein
LEVNLSGFSVTSPSLSRSKALNIRSEKSWAQCRPRIPIFFLKDSLVIIRLPTDTFKNLGVWLSTFCVAPRVHFDWSGWAHWWCDCGCPCESCFCWDSLRSNSLLLNIPKLLLKLENIICIINQEKERSGGRSIRRRLIRHAGRLFK